MLEQDGSKEVYLEAKRPAKRAVYHAKRAPERREIRKCVKTERWYIIAYKIVQQMTGTNREIIGGKYLKNYSGVLATTDQEKHLARAQLETATWRILVE